MEDWGGAALVSWPLIPLSPPVCLGRSGPCQCGRRADPDGPKLPLEQLAALSWLRRQPPADGCTRARLASQVRTQLCCLRSLWQPVTCHNQSFSISRRRLLSPAIPGRRRVRGGLGEVRCDGFPPKTASQARLCLSSPRSPHQSFCRGRGPVGSAGLSLFFEAIPSHVTHGYSLYLKVPSTWA